ncbi:hypothetical protein FB550_10961 [Neobacillus bataviensis]|uniref:Uncharacterized protein n=1 Tax=Neobacillus bataviensis TaxID=220685 RepID=A0A561D527_9BACI|nr:hypothetical protein [Neobacillus bataviensis]TWD98555.1 hypothetical protein FB550_10961 [Neobacillus bataviensis]
MENFNLNDYVNGIRVADELDQPILIQAKTLEYKLIVNVYSSDVITYRPKNVPSLPKDRN